MRFRPLRALCCAFVAPAGAAASPSPAIVEAAVALALEGGAVLHGTLVRPATAHRPPVVLLIAGSGPTDRDGDNPLLPVRNQSLRLLATGLADAGIASVRYDKRGVGESAAAVPDESALRFDTYVDDAAAWLRQLQSDRRFGAVGVVGHSEGALIATLAARRTQAQAVVSIAGQARRASDVLRDQLANRLPLGLAAENEAILQALEQGRTVPGVPATLSAFYRDSVQPYLVSWFRYAPTREFAALQAPALVVQGDADLQVGVGDARALAHALPGARLLVVPDMNHVLKTVPADDVLQARSSGDPALPLADGLVASVAGFLNAVLSEDSPDRPKR